LPSQEPRRGARLSPDELRRLVREAKAAMSISHPNCMQW
jgi:hypothetical protein